MTYGRAFSLFSNVQGKARPNLTGRLLKERGNGTCKIRLIDSGIAFPLVDATWTNVLLYGATRERDAKYGLWPGRRRIERCREWCVTCVEWRTTGHAMWNDRLSRAHPRPSPAATRSTSWIPCTWTLFAIVLLALRDLRRTRCATYSRWGFRGGKFICENLANI